jgi:hypothetical protein
VSDPADDLVPQRPRPLGNAPKNLDALERSGQIGKLLILRDPSMAAGDPQSPERIVITSR